MPFTASPRTGSPAHGGAPAVPVGTTAGARDSRGGAAAVTGAALLWGSMGPVAALYPHGSGLAVAAGRLIVGGLVLLIGVTAGRGWTRWRVQDLPLTLAGIATVAGYSALYFPAVQLCGVATATVVSIGGAPLLAGLANLLRGRRIAPRWAWSTGAGTVGMTLVVLPGSHDPSNWLGVLLAAGAAATYALQAHYIEALGQRHRPAEVVAVLFSASAVILAPAVVPLLPLLTSEPAAAGGIVYLGLFTTSIAYWLFATGVRHVGAPIAVTLSLIEPVAAAVLGAVVAHEVPGLLQIGGVTVTVTALAVLSARPATIPPTQPAATQ